MSRESSGGPSWTAKFDATDKVNAFLTAHAEAEKPKAQTVGYYITGLKAFCRWAAKNRRMQASPLALMDKPAAEDSTRERRVITGEQFQALINAARVGSQTQRLTGEQRAWVYLVSAATGLRAGEVATLTP